MSKFLIVAELRDLEEQVSKGEITYSRMVEILNEKAEKYATRKYCEIDCDARLYNFISMHLYDARRYVMIGELEKVTEEIFNMRGFGIGYKRQLLALLKKHEFEIIKVSSITQSKTNV